MKFTSLQRMMLSFLLIAIPVTASFGQEKQRDKDKKNTIRIKVVEEENGKVRNIEKNYQVQAMTDKERKEFVDKVLDSLNIDSKNQKSLSVTIDDGDGEVTTNRQRRKVIIDHPEDHDALAFNWKGDFSDDFEFDTRELRNQMRNFEKEFKPQAKVFLKDMEDLGDRMGGIWEKEFSKPSNIRSLSAYSNNPDNGVLNLRFNVPAKGDVTVTITDTKGKEVGSKEIKDFSGEFVGQIDLKKNTKGTVFVTVVQNEDGMVKRVVIP